MANKAYRSELKEFSLSLFQFVLIMALVMPMTIPEFAYANKPVRGKKSSKGDQGKGKKQSSKTAVSSSKYNEESNFDFRKRLDNNINGAKKAANFVTDKLEEELTEANEITTDVHRALDSLADEDKKDFVIPILDKAMKYLEALYGIEPTKNGKISPLMEKASKQVACLFIAESHFSTFGDQCDLNNIAQIRPEAYEEVVSYCRGDKKFSDGISVRDNLSLIDKNLTCDNFHPYELPLCRSDVPKFRDEYTTIDTVIGEEIENSALFKGGINSPFVSISDEQIREGKMKKEFSCVSYEKFEYLNPKSTFSSGIMELPSVVCKNTSKEVGVKIPAVREHSIFAGLTYLKIQKYDPRNISNSDFARFAPKKYNRSNDKEQRIYEAMLNICFKEFEEPKNKKILEKTFATIMDFRNLSPKSNIASLGKNGKTSNTPLKLHNSKKPITYMKFRKDDSWFEEKPPEEWDRKLAQIANKAHHDRAKQKVKRVNNPKIVKPRTPALIGTSSANQ